MSLSEFGTVGGFNKNLLFKQGVLDDQMVGPYDLLFALMPSRAGKSRLLRKMLR